MGMTERDRKLLAIFACVVFLGGYWFLVLGKKRSAVSEAQAAKTSAQQALLDATAKETAGAQEKKKYPVKYSRVLKMGKAIPIDSDFPSLLVQVSDISADSDVDFQSLTISQGAPASAAAAANGPTGSTTCDVKLGTDGASASTGASGATGAVVQPSAATSSVGTQVNTAKAGEATASNDGNRAADSNADFAAKCASSPSLTDVTAQASGLNLYTYNFTFNGSFFDLHNVFDGLMDMVRTKNGRVQVTGRLLQINNFKMSVKEFPVLEATVEMTGYSLPAGTTITAGATASGPAGTAAAAAVTTPAPADGAPPAAAPPSSTILGVR
jgi:hypothetical protein